GGEALLGRVDARRPDTVVGGDADDVEGVDLVAAQPVRELDGVLRLAFEAAIARGELALGEHGVDAGDVERFVELGSGRTGDAVPWPGVDVVGVVGEVPAGVDVVVAGRDDVVVVVTSLPQQV